MRPKDWFYLLFDIFIFVYKLFVEKRAKTILGGGVVGGGFY